MPPVLFREKYKFSYEDSALKTAFGKGICINMKYDAAVTGQVIGRLRIERGMTQQELSKRAYVARSHLAMIECGRRNANVDTLWRISEALGIRLSELMRMVEREIERGIEK